MRLTAHIIIAAQLICSVVLTAGEHPSLVITVGEAAAIREDMGKYPLFVRSFEAMKARVETALNRPIEVPPPGEGGGYEHERHKQNYREMQEAGIYFTITGDKRAAGFIRDMLLKYADLYPNLGRHPQAKDQAPGKLFHQMLNETLWLTNAAMAYDCVHDQLTPAVRAGIEKNLFRPMIAWFTNENRKEFNRIHNHGTWTVCSIGLIGYVLGDRELVEMALYGTDKDGQGGFLKQLDLLFSPDGYYMEGPYYARYALQPFFIFAEAIERNQPELKIYEHRGQILKKAWYSAVQTTFPNGIFPPINDASRTMDIRDSGMILTNSLAYARYGADPQLLPVAQIQQEVPVSGAGLILARAFARAGEVPGMTWPSIEFTDGWDGRQGGLGILRSGEGREQSMLLMKYGVHGEGHGHFDKLQFIFYDQGREVIPDYGFCRWINIEPKMGGRYLPENKSWAMQTIAHNTVTVDRKCQNDGSRKEADEMSGQRHFFETGDPRVQVMSARAEGYYPGVSMQRTMLLVRDERLPYPVVVDLFRVVSDRVHCYDYPIHYRGQLIAADFNYQAFGSEQQPLGTEAGYQHIWREASAAVAGPLRLTWLDGNRYYTLLTAGAEAGEFFFGRSGASDPSFNLISEPIFILRKEGQNYLFASVIEPHGWFSEAHEQSRDARGRLTTVKVIGHDETGSVVEVEGANNLRWRIMVSNGPASSTAVHTMNLNGTSFSWTGNYRFEF
ncbi:MAG TPA: alginate lyase family protein [bacterium]|mgnify:CR=1 FL=1|nr:alginate lyase family protein [bacterium]HPG82827.1 alginate lyase family protein [bacterium]HPM59631.1 alginate lyase family protein [bacterium]